MGRAQILAEHGQRLPKALSPLRLRATSPQQPCELIAGRPLVSTERQNREQRALLTRGKPDRVCAPIGGDDLESAEQSDAEAVKHFHLATVSRKSLTARRWV